MLEIYHLSPSLPIYSLPFPALFFHDVGDWLASIASKVLTRPLASSHLCQDEHQQGIGRRERARSRCSFLWLHPALRWRWYLLSGSLSAGFSLSLSLSLQILLTTSSSCPFRPRDRNGDTPAPPRLTFLAHGNTLSLRFLQSTLLGIVPWLSFPHIRQCVVSSSCLQGRWLIQ